MRPTGAELDPPVAEPSSRAFEAFYADQHAGLFGALYLIAGNRQEAEELMQDAFLKIWERWDRVESLEDPTGYLYRTALNLFRMRRRRAAVAVRQAVGRLPPSNAFDAVDRKDMVDRALASLAPRQRAAVVLMDLLGYSSEEASRMLGVKAVTVRVLASQARAVLRRTMEPSDE
jgi:RNA polymerase sigma-70 factor (ECF subfamily)